MAGQLSEKQKHLKDITDEIQEIEARPDSNIDVRYQQLRDEMIGSLNLPSEELVFIGELLDVKDDDKSWQGAIERALGGLRTTLLVPQKSYSMVTRWLNVRHTGLHVRAQVVQPQSNQKSPGFTKFSERGYLRKLVWKEHPYRDWLKSHLNKFDLQCVSDTDELDASPFSMTKEGLVHLERGRFEKKDQRRIDDRKSWSLGFSNKSRLMLLNADKKDAESRLKELNTTLSNARSDLDKIKEKEKLWERLSAYAWEQVNAPYWQKRLETVETDLQKLEQSGGNLELAKSRWEATKKELQEIQNKKGELLKKEGFLDNDRKNATAQVEKYQQLAATGITDDVKKLLSKRIGEVTLENANRQSDFEKALDAELEKVRSDKNTAENMANGVMASFRGRDKWQPITVDWATGLEGLQDYLDHYLYVETEGLPELIDQFQERLNKHATQSLARIKTKLESEREDILERIDTINRVLKRTEFRQGSHLKLGSKREKYPHVQDFERKIKSALSKATSDDHEARFNLLEEVVEILEKASATVYIQQFGKLKAIRLKIPDVILCRRNRFNRLHSTRRT